MKFTKFALSISTSSEITILFNLILRLFIISSEFLKVNDVLTFALSLALSLFTKGILALTSNKIYALE